MIRLRREELQANVGASTLILLPMPKSALPERPVAFSRAFLRARREALAILGLWGVCLLWCVGYSSLYGYSTDAASEPTLWGMPRWIVGGVFAPWLTATLASVLFSLFVMKDDDEEDEAATNEANDA